MAETYFPFDTGAGANVQETQWAKMARNWLNDGVIPNYLNLLLAFADNTGMQIKLPTGAAWIEGVYYENDAQQTLAIAASDPANPRIDRLVIRVDWVANTVAAVIKTGVAAGAPAPPALTQNFGVTWELPIAQIAVAAAVGSIVAGNVTDQRVYASPNSTFLSGLTVLGPAVFTNLVTIQSAFSNSVNIGANGATNPTVQIDSSTIGSVTGVRIASAASGAGVSISAISSNANENLYIRSKGTGRVTFDQRVYFSVVSTTQFGVEYAGTTTATGGMTTGVYVGASMVAAVNNDVLTSLGVAFSANENGKGGLLGYAIHILPPVGVTVNTTYSGILNEGPTTLQTNSDRALIAGPNGIANPTLQVDCSTASAVTGLKVKAGVSGAGVALSVVSSNANDALLLDAKGSQPVKIATVSTGGLQVRGNTFFTGTLVANNKAFELDSTITSSAGEADGIDNRIGINAGANNDVLISQRIRTSINEAGKSGLVIHSLFIDSPSGVSAGTYFPITVPGAGYALIHAQNAITNGAGAGAGTLTNAPVAGNPTKWAPVNDGGTVRYVPLW